MHDNISTLSNSLQEAHRDDIKIILTSDYLNSHRGVYVSLNTLQPLVEQFITGMIVPNNDGNPEAAQMSKLMKTAVKGILIMYGEKILTLMLGRDHEKPAKGVDLVEWYTKQFAKIALAMGTKQVYHIVEKEVGESDTTEISGFATVTLSES